MIQAELAFEQGEKAMAKVLKNAEAATPGFKAKAQAFILRYLRERGETNGETITDACKDAGIVPHDDRAFGPVYRSLSAGGMIEKCGYAARLKGHGTSGAIIWRLKQ